jgi:CBS domain-containing protein
LSITSTALDQLTVGDVMRHGTLSCQPETPLRTVARMMSEHRVHSVVVTELDGVGETVWGIVTDADILRAVGGELDELSAGTAAATELLTVSPDEGLEIAARTMAGHELTHLVVVSRGKPVGVLSSLDVAAAIGA